MSRLQVYTVTIDEVLYRAATGPFCVLRGTTDDGANSQSVVVVGELGHSDVGETLRIQGYFEQHATYGRRLRVQSFAPVLPSTSAGIARYLGSGLITGVGPAIAQRLVERFGDKTLDVITTQSARLREVAGIGEQRALAIATAVRTRHDEAESLSFLQGLGLGAAIANRVRQRYGSEAPRIVREDPYLVAEQVPGIGFRTADAVAGALGYTRDDPRRVAGAVLHLVARAADEGHSFLRELELEHKARGLDVPAERVPQAVRELALRELVTTDGDAVYAPPLHRAETCVAERFRTLARRRAKVTDWERDLQALADMHLAVAQLSAVRATLEASLLVVTGGPGTGKTTIVRAIVALHRAAKRRMALCAPTGRAAKRLSDASGYEAQTIHRMLEWNPRAGSFGRNADSPLEADLILVDEASMLDVQLAHALLEALPTAASLVLVGDADQLPPVGPGPVLRELIDSGVARVVRLHEVFRQASASTIVRAAHDVLHGRVPAPTPTGTRSRGDLFYVRASDPETIGTRLAETLQRMQAAYGLDPRRDVQVLTPMRRGPAGTEALNELLQRVLNPNAAPALADRVPARHFRSGDKVMQLRNDYEREIWNGDVGEVTRVDAGIVFVDFGGREVSYEPDALHALSLAYACTVHKVQGSEFPGVVLVLTRAHHVLLSRPLLYTALTRAKQLAVIVGDDAAIERAVRNAEQRSVNTRLAARLSVP